MTISRRVRWIRFNLVGVMGFALQTMTLWLLVRWTGVNASVAITLAVLAAVSHNFAWHETVTWPNLPAERRFRRWLYFQFSTGAISLLTGVSGWCPAYHAAGLTSLEGPGDRPDEAHRSTWLAPSVQRDAGGPAAASLETPHP